MTATCYRFKPWARLQGDPQKVGETLEQLRLAHGTLSPGLVVSAAKDRESILHGYFTWDDSKAAEEHRRSQAAHLMRSICVVSAPGIALQAPTRAFVSVRRAAEESTDGEAAGTYTSIVEAVRVVDYRAQLVGDALRDLDAYRLKYQLLADLTGWRAALEKARDVLQRAADEVDKEPA